MLHCMCNVRRSYHARKNTIEKITSFTVSYYVGTEKKWDEGVGDEVDHFCACLSHIRQMSICQINQIESDRFAANMLLFFSCFF